LFGRVSVVVVWRELLFGSFFDLRDHPLTRGHWRKLLRLGAFPHSFTLDQGGTPKILRSTSPQYPLANFVRNDEPIPFASASHAQAQATQISWRTNFTN
jgi:hypothetical protein